MLKGISKKSINAVIKKATAFYGSDKLVTEPSVLKGYKAPTDFVELGIGVAIEYDCDKFDGKMRIYRHDITKKRMMYMSLDGSTIVIDPPLKLTKRGIEG